jgi:hypothetical protein
MARPKKNITLSNGSTITALAPKRRGRPPGVKNKASSGSIVATLQTRAEYHAHMAQAYTKLAKLEEARS